MKKYKDKVAVITGAAQEWDKTSPSTSFRGCNIALVEWKEELLNETRELLKNIMLVYLPICWMLVIKKL